MTKNANEWNQARELQARAAQLAADAPRGGERAIGQAADRLAREFDLSLTGESTVTEDGKPLERFDALAADISELARRCQAGPAREREDGRGRHNGLSRGELRQLLWRIENNARLDRDLLGPKPVLVRDEGNWDESNWGDWRLNTDAVEL
jgi:hypothetical protein